MRWTQDAMPMYRLTFAQHVIQFAASWEEGNNGIGLFQQGLDSAYDTPEG